MTAQVALVGPPNAGKTTLYNWLTGSRYRTVNYPGSTVEYQVGRTLDTYGESFEVFDTPGIRSLNAISPDEAITIDSLCEGNQFRLLGALVVPVDSTQLSRHLLLVRQLQESGFEIVVALTMSDVAEASGLKIDMPLLTERLGGITICPVVATTGQGINELRNALVALADQPAPLPTAAFMPCTALPMESGTASVALPRVTRTIGPRLTGAAVVVVAPDLCEKVRPSSSDCGAAPPRGGIELRWKRETSPPVT